MENIIKNISDKFHANITFRFKVILVKASKFPFWKIYKKKKKKTKLPWNSKNYISNSPAMVQHEEHHKEYFCEISLKYHFSFQSYRCFDLHPEFFQNRCGLTQLLNVHYAPIICKNGNILSQYCCINYFTTRYQSDNDIQESKPSTLPFSISTDL